MAPVTRSRNGCTSTSPLFLRTVGELKAKNEAKAKKVTAATAVNTTTTSPTPAPSAAAASSSPSTATISTTPFMQTRAQKRKAIEETEEAGTAAPVSATKKQKVAHLNTEKRKRIEEEAVEVRGDEKEEPVRQYKKVRQTATKAKVVAKKNDEEVLEVVSARSARATSTTRRALNKVKALSASSIVGRISMSVLEAGESVVAHSDGIADTVTVTGKGWTMTRSMPVWDSAIKTAVGGKNQQEKEEKVREKAVKKERKGEQDKKEEITGRGIIPPSSSSSSSTQLVKTSRPLKSTYPEVEGDYDTDITLDDTDSEASDLEDSDLEDSESELDYDNSTDTDSDLATSFTASQASSSSSTSYNLKTTTSNTNNDEDDEDIPTISSAAVRQEFREMMGRATPSKRAQDKKQTQNQH